MRPATPPRLADARNAERRALLHLDVLDPGRDQARDVGQSFEQPGHHHLRGPVLARQRAQRGGHHRRVVGAVVAQHAHQAELRRARGADELLEARLGARHDERALVERQHLAESVVAAHGHYAGGAREQRLELAVEGDRVDALELRRAVHELGLALGLHERPEHQQRRIRQQRIVLVGAQHPVDQPVAVAAAAGGHQQERLVDDLGQARRRAVRRHLARQVAGVDHLLAHGLGQRDAFERIADLRQAVHPDLVVELAQRGQRLLALPLGLEQAGLVHHVAQAEDQARAPLLQHLEGLQQLAAQPDRLLVDDEHVGRELLCGVLDDGGAHRHRLADVEVQVERRVLAVAQLDHAGHAHEVDARAEIEAADDRRAGEDQDRELLVALDQRVRDRPAAAQVAEAEGVVAVDEYAAIVPPGPHGAPPLLLNPIFGCPCGDTQVLTYPAGLAVPAGQHALEGPPTGPCQVEQLPRQTGRQLGLGSVEHWIGPLHVGLAQLAGAVAGVHLVEHSLLARAAVRDIGVGRERAERDAVAARRVDRHLARDESDRQVVDRDRLEAAEIKRRLGIAERPIVRAAIGHDRIDRAPLGAIAPFTVDHVDVMHAQFFPHLFLRTGEQLHQHRGAVESTGEHHQRGHAPILCLYYDSPMSVKKLLDLSGKVALVTGGSRGLGLQIAEALGEMGAKLAITARKKDELDSAVAHLQKQNVHCVSYVSDIGKREAIAPVAEEILKKFGRVDILVNNAGATWGAKAEEHPLDAWDKLVSVNLSGLFTLTQIVASKSMIPAKWGRIVNVASIAGLMGQDQRFAPTAAYTATKHGVVGLTRQLAAEWGVHGITVNAICPGFFPSKMTRATLDKMSAAIVDLTPNRRLGNEEDLKGLAVLLASEAGRHITGQAIAVDGGMTIVCTSPSQGNTRSKFPSSST